MSLNPKKIENPEDDSVLQNFGVCRYCGQSSIIKSEMYKNDADEQVTKFCNCIGAEKARLIKYKIQRGIAAAEKALNVDFGSLKPVKNSDFKVLLLGCITPFVNCDADKIVINAGDEKFTIKNGDDVHILRSRNTEVEIDGKEEYEEE
jgi:hypothetical protein